MTFLFFNNFIFFFVVKSNKKKSIKKLTISLSSTKTLPKPKNGINHQLYHLKLHKLTKYSNYENYIYR